MSTDYPVTDGVASEADPTAEAVTVPALPTTQHDAPEGDAPEETFADDDGVLYDEQVKPEYGILGFTLRELLIVGVWLVAFITSFFPLAGGGASIWAQGIQWILPIGVPTAAVFLVVLRRFSPDGIRRVGSLGIDQFASVAFSVAAVFWLQAIWTAVQGWVAVGVIFPAWVSWVQLVTMLALVALTVFAPIIPGICEDFKGRRVTLAHRSANPIRPVIARPRAEKIAPAAPVASPESDATAFDDASDTATSVIDVESSDQSATDEIESLGFGAQVPLTSHASGGVLGTVTGADESDYVPSYARRSRGQDPADEVVEPVEEAAEPASVTDVDATNPRAAAPAAQPFWALASTEREVLDERGEVLFRIGPSAWALVVEDRGGAYVVRHDDGRIGYLHDIADITRG